MELRNSLYRVVSSPLPCQGEGGVGVFCIELLSDCVIYRSHFPGRPITPGACMIQIVQELAQTYYGDVSLKVQHISNLKFLALLEPQHHPDVEVLLQGTPGNLKAELSDGDLVFARFAFSLT